MLCNQKETNRPNFNKILTTMKVTQKQVLKLHKELFIVMTFSKETGRRTMTYGNLNHTLAFQFIIRKQETDNFLIFKGDKETYSELHRLEWKREDGHNRCTFEDALPFALKNLAV